MGGKGKSYMLVSKDNQNVRKSDTEEHTSAVNWNGMLPCPPKHILQTNRSQPENKWSVLERTNKKTNLKSQFTFLETAITRGLPTSGWDDPTNPIAVCGYAMDGDSSFSGLNRKESAWRSTFDSWVGKSPGEGNANLLQHSCLENSMDRRAWRATIHGVAESQTQLSD